MVKLESKSFDASVNRTENRWVGSAAIIDTVGS
jgi:hypothetical protein